MSKKKLYNIKIEINDCKSSGEKTYEIKYAKIQKLFIIVYKDGIGISFSRSSKVKNPDEYYFNQTLRELYKKAFFLFVLTNKKCFEAKRLQTLDGYICNFSSNKALFFSMLNGHSRIFLPSNCDCVINEICNQPRGKYSSKVISFESYLLGCNAQYAYEKFSYFWIAFNAFYNSLKINSNGEVDKLNDLFNSYSKKQLICTGSEKTIGRVKRNKIFAKLYLGFDKEKNKQILKLRINKEIVTTNWTEDDYGLFIMIHYSYYLRCNLFHGSFAIPLVVTRNDPEISRLQYCCDLLGEFLKVHMFDDLNVMSCNVKGKNKRKV